MMQPRRWPGIRYALEKEYKWMRVDRHAQLGGSSLLEKEDVVWGIKAAIGLDTRGEVGDAGEKRWWGREGKKSRYVSSMIRAMRRSAQSWANEARSPGGYVAPV
jgi:hypothetical protein